MVIVIAQQHILPTAGIATKNTEENSEIDTKHNLTQLQLSVSTQPFVESVHVFSLTYINRDRLCNSVVQNGK